MSHKSLLASLVCILAMNASATSIYCSDDKPRSEVRSRELRAMAQADKEDRKNELTLTPEEWDEVAKRDEDRRKRVGEIFGEGCFSKAEDYAAAALIYQHGTTPDHFFQAFIWSKRGIELGDLSQKMRMAEGIDRYLVNTGRKQLLGTQAFQQTTGPDQCICLRQVERNFPDTLRKEFTGKTYAEALAWIADLNAGTACPNKECTQDLKPSPKGTIPGFW